MKTILAVLAVAALSGCASTPAPKLTPGNQIVIGAEPSKFNAAGTRKTPVAVTVVVETSEAPVLDRRLFAVAK